METGSEDGQSRVSGKAREVCLRDAPSSAEEGRNAGQVLTFVVTGYGERSGDADQAFVELKRSWIRGTLGKGDDVEASELWIGDTFQAEHIINHSRGGSRVAAVELPRVLKVAVIGLPTVFALVWTFFAVLLQRLSGKLTPCNA